MSINYVLVGDIHSQSNKLESALNWIQSSIENYHIIFLGDVFDSRNDFSDSVGVYNIVRDLENKGVATTIQSNHQYKLLRYYKGNKISISNGIDKTIEDFNKDSSINTSEVYSWLESLPYGVVFYDKFNTQYRAAHAYFPSDFKIPWPHNFDEIYKIYEVNRKTRDQAIYGPHRKLNETGTTERIEWWKENRDRRWIRVAGHYHTICEDFNTNSLVLDGGCGVDGGMLVAYDVNSKTLKTF